MRLKLSLFVALSLAGLTPVLAQDEDEPPSYPTTEFADGATAAAVESGGVVATVTMARRPEIDAEFEVPVLTVSVAGRQVLEAVGVASGLSFPAASASIVELDPGNRTPEVYFTAYSGGAHCCSTVIVATATSAGWQAITVGEFDGGGEYLDDLDGDGLAEIATVDNRFLYTFDCYACSAAPLVVLAIRSGTVVDVSDEPRFQPAHRRWLAELEEGVDPQERWSSPGFIAGWVAAKARLGEGDEAFAELAANWDGAADPGEEVCRAGGDLDQCPAADRVTLPFPDRLRLFLEQAGYRL